MLQKDKKKNDTLIRVVNKKKQHALDYLHNITTLCNITTPMSRISFYIYISYSCTLISTYYDTHYKMCSFRGT